LKELFNKIRQDNGNMNTESDKISAGKIYIIRCSYFEIYNDAVFDLLCEIGDESFHEPLQLQEDIKVSL
jgi:hypothetical protein